MTKKGSLDFLLLIYYIESRRRLRLCHIAPADFNLLELFIKTPKHLLTKEDIKNAFWPKDNNPENKIYSHISTLKSSLKDFPEYQIVTEKGGYRLVISSNE